MYENLKFHPLADLFPLIDGEEFAGLVADIRERGLEDPITLYENTILDGRNRYRACIEAGREFTDDMFTTYSGDDPKAFVISKNIHRRMLPKFQIAAILAEMDTVGPGGDRRQNEQTGVVEPKGTNVPAAPTVEKLANNAGINRKTLQRARKTKRENPELHKLHVQGKKPPKPKAEPKKVAPPADTPKDNGEMQTQVVNGSTQRAAQKPNIRPKILELARDRKRSIEWLAKELNTDHTHVIASVSKTTEAEKQKGFVIIYTANSTKSRGTVLVTRKPNMVSSAEIQAKLTPIIEALDKEWQRPATRMNNARIAEQVTFLQRLLDNWTSDYYQPQDGAGNSDRTHSAVMDSENGDV